MLRAETSCVQKCSTEGHDPITVTHESERAENAIVMMKYNQRLAKPSLQHPCTGQWQAPSTDVLGAVIADVRNATLGQRPQEANASSPGEQMWAAARRLLS